MDLTVPDADPIKEFYRAVVGWTSTPVDMGEYSDFNMNAPESGETIAGICHARGGNKELPAQWLFYVRVKDVDQSCRICLERGGEVILEPKDMGEYGRYCVIRDPAGAAFALITPPA